MVIVVASALAVSAAVERSATCGLGGRQADRKTAHTRKMIEMNGDGRDSDEGALPKEGESDSMDHHFGRRVEVDRSWTVYHVFSGAPANRAGQSMIGLGRQAATEGMLSMNLRNVHRRKERIMLNAPQPAADEIDVPEQG